MKYIIHRLYRGSFLWASQDSPFGSPKTQTLKSSYPHVGLPQSMAVPQQAYLPTLSSRENLARCVWAGPSQAILPYV